MISNHHTKRRTGPAIADRYDFFMPAVGCLRVTAAERSEVLHLAVVDDVEQVPWTLCAHHVSRREPTGQFQDSGCWFCASIALSTGHTVAEEHHAGLVDIRQWLAGSQAPNHRPLSVRSPHDPVEAR